MQIRRGHAVDMQWNRVDVSRYRSVDRKTLLGTEAGLFWSAPSFIARGSIVTKRSGGEMEAEERSVNDIPGARVAPGPSFRRDGPDRVRTRGAVVCTLNRVLLSFG